MTEMTKAERLEHTRSLINAIPICRLYASMSEKKRRDKMKAEIEPKRPPRPDKPVRLPYLERKGKLVKCNRCGWYRRLSRMHKSKMYDGYICNDSEKCLKEKMK